MAQSLTSKVARAQPTVLAIFRKVIGTDADASVVLGDLENGVEQLLELVEAAFELDGSWTGEGTAVNGTLDAFVRQVAQHWDGDDVSHKWTIQQKQLRALVQARSAPFWSHVHCEPRAL